MLSNILVLLLLTSYASPLLIGIRISVEVRLRLAVVRDTYTSWLQVALHFAYVVVVVDILTAFLSFGITARCYRHTLIYSDDRIAVFWSAVAWTIVLVDSHVLFLFAHRVRTKICLAIILSLFNFKYCH